MEEGKLNPLSSIEKKVIKVQNCYRQLGIAVFCILNDLFVLCVLIECMSDCRHVHLQSKVSRLPALADLFTKPLKPNTVFKNILKIVAVKLNIPPSSILLLPGVRQKVDTNPTFGEQQVLLFFVFFRRCRGGVSLLTRRKSPRAGPLLWCS